MLFDRLSLRWSPKINIISGENSTGKTTLIKAMYAALKGVSEGRLDRMTKEEIEGGLVKSSRASFVPTTIRSAAWPAAAPAAAGPHSRSASARRIQSPSASAAGRTAMPT